MEGLVRKRGNKQLAPYKMMVTNWNLPKGKQSTPGGSGGYGCRKKGSGQRQIDYAKLRKTKWLVSIMIPQIEAREAVLHEYQLTDSNNRENHRKL